MSATDPVLAAVLTHLGGCLLERVGPRTFRVRGEPPGWSVALFGSECLGDEAGAFDPIERIPFLEGFLPDAEAVWRGEAADAMSGHWTQELPGTDSAEAPAELVLECRAMLVGDGRELLLIQRVTDRFQEKRRILQKARGALLEYEHLRKEVDRKELLLHCIVHDLRGPLSGMVGSMSLVQSRKLSIEDAQELLEVGLEQARYQESMIKSVLEAFAAEVRDLESFDATADTAPDLRAALEAVAKRYASAFRAGEVTLEMDLSTSLDTPCPVVGRKDRLERVLENLLENALRYAPAQSVVRVGVGPSGGNVLVTVEDEGPGVPPDVQERLFDKLSQGRRSKGVVGLGLYFCRSTLELWGGGIEYVPHAGKGARFRIRLRRAI